MDAEEERDEETSQLWILRHLRSLLVDVEDSVLSSFILQQDCTPLRNFVNSYRKRRVLYIGVKRTEAVKRISISLPQLTSSDNEQKAWRAPVPLTIKKAMGKRSVTKKRKKKVKRIVDTVEFEPTKEEEIALNAEKGEEERTPEVMLCWYDTQLPTNCKQFVFIVTKTHTSKNSGFDQLFHVGICCNGEVYWRLVELATNILGNKVDEYVKVDLLLLFTNVGFRWSDTSNKLKNFVIETIGLLHADQRREEVDALTLPNMQTLLRPRLEAFSHTSSNKMERCRLLMELSLFDVDCIEQCTHSESAAERFTFALSTLRVLHLLHANEHVHFIRKATIYCIETIVKVAAAHLKRKAMSILYGEENESMWKTVGYVALELFAFGSSIMEKGSDDALNVGRIANCFRLMETLEEEINRVRKLASETMDERSDMDRERDALEQAARIITEIGDQFEEKGIISVVESGNADALKALIIDISAHFSTLSILLSNRITQKY